MPSSFSARRYFKYIQKPELLTAYYATHGITASFGIDETTPRNIIPDVLYDFYKHLDPEKKFDIERELAFIDSISIVHTPALFIALLKKRGSPHEVTQIECVTVQDKVLYYYLHHREVLDEVLFFLDFYTTRRYLVSEATNVSLVDAEYRVIELKGEFARIANKNDRVTECEVKAGVLDGLLYISATFEGAPSVAPHINKETGEMERARTVRKIERVLIVYFPKEGEALIAYTGSKQERTVFLDAFLRIVCGRGYEEKVESYDLSVCKTPAFNFQNDQEHKLLSWRVRSVTLAFGDEKKKKIRFSLPNVPHQYGMTPFTAALKEFGIEDRSKNFMIEQIAFSFSFVDREDSEKSVNVSSAVSSLRASLCPLFPYDRSIRALLKQSGVYRGFVDIEKKENKKEKADEGISEL